MMDHIYYYATHAEQRYFLGPTMRDQYNKIGINGNIVSYTPSGVASFLATANKPFYIDPQTHIFQFSTQHLKKNNDPKKKFKPSIEILASDRLKGPFSSVVTEDKPLLPSVFYEGDEIDLEKVDIICRGCLEFQKNTIIEEINEEDIEFLDTEENLTPQFLIAPYFYISSKNSPKWLDLTSICYSRTKELENNFPIYLSLVIAKDIVFDAREKERVIEKIRNIKPDGILLWVDDLEEESLSVDKVQKYIQFLKSLKTNTGIVINTHSGYLSILFGHPEVGGLFDGISHGINYGESRSVVPVGGGIPMARFYFYSVHSRLRWGDALQIVQKNNWWGRRETYAKNVCSCKQCHDLIAQSNTVEDAFFYYGRSQTVERKSRSGSRIELEYPTSEAKQAAANHYLFNKTREINSIQNFTLAEIFDQLTDSYNKTAPILGDDQVAHLNNWRIGVEREL